MKNKKKLYPNCPHGSQIVLWSGRILGFRLSVNRCTFACQRILVDVAKAGMVIWSSGHPTWIAWRHFSA